MKTCNICCDNINKGNKKEVKCPYCDFSSCLVCFRTYLMNNSRITADCMNCHRELSIEFIAEVTPKVFHSQEYRNKRAEDLLSREKSLLPATQHLVEARKERERREKIINELNDELKYLKERSREIREEIFRLRTEPIDGENGAENGGEKERKKFIMGCPAENCRGFLSQAWKCGTCGIYACPHCRCIKGAREDAEHVCDKEAVETAKLLAQDTKCCPSCATPIYKIAGCFALNTPVLTWNGNIKMSQDININDELIGDDGTKRTVLNLVDGYDKMYKVSQNKGESYIVNSKHTLALKYTCNGNICWYPSMNAWVMKWWENNTIKSKKISVKPNKTKQQAFDEIENFKNSIIIQDPVLITVEDYIKLEEKIKQQLLGYKTKDIHWEYKSVYLDPYILGTWLGDGYSNGTGFCTNDDEILQVWSTWSSSNDASITDLNQKYRYYVRRNKNSSSKTNPLKEQLNKYNLINNKHIPQNYLINSREVRLKLLAGIIDTDGCVQNCGRRITIVQSNPNLSKQIKFLAQSLGFAVSISYRNRNNGMTFTINPKNYKEQQIINISGEKLGDIPTIIPRKKCKNQIVGVDLLRTSIKVEYIGVDKYYGWSIDNNKLFLGGDFTIWKNCDQMYCTSCHTPFSWKTGQIVTGVIHNPHFYEWQRQQNGGVAPRVPGDVPCGGLPWINIVRAILVSRKQEDNGITRCHRMINHIREIEMIRYPDRMGVTNNSDLRVMFLMHIIDEETWKRNLKMRQKRAEKDREIHQILEMFHISATDIFNTYVAGNILTIQEPLEQLRAYTNRNLLKIKHKYNVKVPYLEANWKLEMK